jgi:hypothetical protein
MAMALWRATLVLALLLSNRVEARPALSTKTRLTHTQQIRARGTRPRARAERAVAKHYWKLVKMLRSARQRKAAAEVLVGLVEQASTPGRSGDSRLYPRLDKRNHDRFNAACTRNLRRLLGIAATLARGSRRQRQVARRMVKAARTLEYGALVALVRASLRLGDRDNARWAAAQAILHFPPADRLVRKPTGPTRLGRRDAATILFVLRSLRARRTPWHAMVELRREDTRYDSRSVVPRLQAIGYLASRTRGWAASWLTRELGRWESVANFRLVPHRGDRWVPAARIARVSAMGLGHLREGPVKLARRF